MRSKKWFDKEFKFKLPLEKFDEVISRLEQTPGRIEKLIDSVSPEALTKKPEGKWSAQENIGHLFDLEELHNVRIDDFHAGKKTLSPADLNNRKTFEANHNQKNVDDLLSELKKARKNFVRKLKELHKEMPNAVSIHPRLNQPMRPIDLALFIAEHDEHHIQTIEELIDKLSTY